jgi:hypothetical protein
MKLRPIHSKFTNFVSGKFLFANDENEVPPTEILTQKQIEMR